MRILIINDTSSSPNWGARATSHALRTLISDIGDHCIEILYEDDIRVHKRPENTINKSKDFFKSLIPPIGFEIKERLFPNLNLPTGSQYIPKRWEDFDSALSRVTKENHLSRELEKIQRADVVVIQGEGCIRANSFQSRMMLFLGYMSKKQFNKPTIIVNHTADFSHPELLKIAENVYPLFDDIVFREPLSAQRCNEFCNGRVGGDAAFIFEPISRSQWVSLAARPTYLNFWPDTARFNPARPYICIGGSSGLPSDNSAEYDPLPKYSALITYLQKHFPHQIVLTASGPTDVNIFRSLAAQHNLPLIGLTIPVQQAVDILGNASAYIGGRWHPSIFALLGGAPIVPLAANTFKMEALSKLVGLSDYTIDLIDLDAELQLIGKLLNDYLSQGESLRRDLKYSARKEATKAAENVSYLQRLECLAH